LLRSLLVFTQVLVEMRSAQSQKKRLRQTEAERVDRALKKARATLIKLLEKNKHTQKNRDASNLKNFFLLH